MEVAVTGSHGLIGTALLPALRAAGHRPIRLVRRPAEPGADEISWDVKAEWIDAASLEGVGAVVHLAGAGIGDHRWTTAYKKELLDSRVKGTGLLSRALADLRRPPDVLLSASAIGFYGDRGDEVLTEAAGPGNDFLAELVVAWESAAEPAVEAGIRTAFLRSGLVLSATGGALAKQLPLFKLGLGGRFKSGSQWWSWISIDDEVAAIVHLLGSSVEGAVNLTAPRPVTNREWTRTLGSVLGRPTLLPTPMLGPRLLLGSELARSLLLTSARVLPTVLESDGFAFRHRDLETGLRAVLDR